MEDFKSKKDRISELPSHIRQRIVSFLDHNKKEGIATSLLSSTWRYDWFNFDVDLYGMWVLYQRDGFQYYRSKPLSKYCMHYLDFLDDILTNMKKVQHDYHLAIPKLELRIKEDCVFTPNISSLLTKLKVKELFLSVYLNKINTFPDVELLTFMLTTESLTELHLCNCTLLPAFPTQLILSSNLRLRKLSLCLVQIDEFVIDNLIASCTCIESLSFESCNGLKYLKLFGLSKLKQLNLSSNNDLERVEIDKVPNFHSLKYQPGYSNHSLALSTIGTSENQTPSHEEPRCVTLQLSYLKQLKLYVCDQMLEQNALWMSRLEFLKIFSHEEKLHLPSLASCTSLTHLHLSCRKTTDNWLNTNLSRLVNLKVLVIDFCGELRHVRIIMKHLQSLSIIDCRQLKSLKMDCPNLSAFKYQAFQHYYPLVKGSISASTRVEIKCHWYSNHREQELHLLAFLKKLGNQQYLTLRYFAFKDVRIWKEMVESSNVLPLHHVHRLKLIIGEMDLQSMPHLGVFMEPLLLLFPRLESLILQSCRSIEVIIRFIYEESTELSRKNCGCYASLAMNCWKHSLKNFVIEKKYGFDDDDTMEKLFNSVIRGDK